MEEMNPQSKRRGIVWDEKAALKHWAEICGPSVMSKYINQFLRNECSSIATDSAAQFQKCFTNLFSYDLRCGMPMEEIKTSSFQESGFRARNAEEALLATLNAFARTTEKISEVEYPSPTAFGTWFRRIQGQRSGSESCLAADCLSFMNLDEAVLYISDLYRTSLVSSRLSGVYATFAVFAFSDLKNADLTSADLTEAILNGATFTQAILKDATLNGANLNGANLNRANLNGANLIGASLNGASLNGANLTDADLTDAKLENLQIDGVIASRETLKLLEKFKAPDSSTTDQESLEPLDED